MFVDSAEVESAMSVRKVINVPPVGVGVPIRYTFKTPMRLWSIAFTHTNGEATPQTAYVQLQDSEGSGRLQDWVDNASTPAGGSKQVSFASESGEATNALNTRSCNPLSDVIVDVGNSVEINADSIPASSITNVKLVVEDVWEAGDEEGEEEEE